MQQFYDCITEFIFVEDEPQKADVIFVPGGNYPDAARHAASLYREGYAPYVLPSGKYSIMVGRFVLPEESAVQAFGQEYETEFAYLQAVLNAAGVPDAAILREDRATYTYQNAIFSRETLERHGISVHRAILCCQAFHARRCLMYYQEQFPDTEFLVCPVVTRGISKENWMKDPQKIDTVLGELERCGGQFHAIMREHMGG